MSPPCEKNDSEVAFYREQRKYKFVCSTGDRGQSERMAKPRKVTRAPRSTTGGQSARYLERRAHRGSERKYAAGWNDAAACAVLEAMTAEYKRSSWRTMLEYVTDLLSDEEKVSDLVYKRCTEITDADRDLAMEVLSHHMHLVQEEVADNNMEDAKKRSRACLKPMRDRKATRGEVKGLELPPAPQGRTTLRSWISKKPHKERLRDISKSQRIVQGIGRWPLGWLRKPGVVCYERAAGRIRSERGGKPDAEFVKGLVHTEKLPTAVAKSGDHYVLVTPGKDLRFLTVEEVARGFGVPTGSPLMHMLKTPKPRGALTVNQAVSCLGRGIHVKVAGQIVANLADRGIISPGLLYASAYSGIDTFAAAVEARLGKEWTYEHASEKDDTTRKALLRTWKCRGLTEARCYRDALSDGAAGETRTGLWVHTSECVSFSKRNHKASKEEQASALGEVWKSLEYARRAQPRSIVVENVHEPSVVRAMTGMLARLPGYETVESGRLDPTVDANEPMARMRHFWVLVAGN